MFSFVLSDPCLRVLSFVSCTFSMFGQTAAQVTIVQDERLTVRQMELKAEAKRRWRAEEAKKKAEKEKKRSEERAALLKTASAKAAIRKVRATRKAERARERKGVRGQKGPTRVRLADQGATTTSYELRPLPRRKSAGLASVMEEDEESLAEEKAPALYLVNSISKSHDALVVDQDEELEPLIFTSPVKGGPEKSASLRTAMLGDMKKQCGRQTRKLVRKIRWQPVQ
ncbi:hypothetical protein GGG16DRAFT_113400 [Schizophyllum commune]